MGTPSFGKPVLGASGFGMRLPRLQAPSLIRKYRWWLDGYSPPSVDRIWGIWGSSYTIPEATVYLLKGDYMVASA